MMVTDLLVVTQIKLGFFRGGVVAPFTMPTELSVTLTAQIILMVQDVLQSPWMEV